MKIPAAIVTLMLVALIVLPMVADAQGTVTVTFQIRLDGDVPADQAFAVIYSVPNSLQEEEVVFCGQLRGFEPEEDCVEGGRVYTRTVEIEAGSTREIAFVRQNEEIGRDADFFARNTETFDADRTISASYNFDEEGSGSQPTDEINRATFKLFVYGEVPVGETFIAKVYGEDDASREPEEVIFFCGGPPEGEVDNIPDCNGNGTLHSRFTVQPRGTEIRYRLSRVTESKDSDSTGPSKEFLSGTERLNTDKVITAYYDFTTGQGGAGEGQDSQQEVPEVPDVGYGGMASGGFPLGSTLAVLALVATSGYMLLRRK